MFVEGYKENTPLFRAPEERHVLSLMNSTCRPYRAYEERGIFTVRGGDPVAHYYPVKTGIVTPRITEILSPRIEGLVVTLGQHLLNDGSPVLLPEGTATELGGTGHPDKTTGAEGGASEPDASAEPSTDSERKNTRQ